MRRVLRQFDRGTRNIIIAVDEFFQEFDVLFALRFCETLYEALTSLILFLFGFFIHLLTLLLPLYLLFSFLSFTPYLTLISFFFLPYHPPSLPCPLPPPFPPPSPPPPFPPFFFPSESRKLHQIRYIPHHSTWTVEYLMRMTSCYP